MRTVKSSNDFFDILDSINGGAIVTIGYVTSADLNVPIVKRKNPLTNRMKGYNDYSVFQNESGREIGALVKVTSYNFNYRNRQSVHDEYHNKIKPQMNAIRQEFGVPEVQAKASYKDVVKFGGNGQEVYKGGNESKFGNSYSPQNMFKPLHVKGVVYLVDTQGNIIRGLDEKEVVPYLKAKKEPTGVSALRKMGADEERIQEYINRIKELKFSYRNFEANSILYIVATVNGEKIIYINDNLKRCVDDIDINPQDFIAVAKDRYKKDLQAIQEMFLRNKKKINENINMKKKLVRLTESDLHRIIKESVNRVIKEEYGKSHRSQYMLGRLANRQSERGERPTANDRAYAMYNNDYSNDYIQGFHDEEKYGRNSDSTWDGNKHRNIQFNYGTKKMQDMDELKGKFIDFIEKYRGGVLLQTIVDYESGNETGKPQSPLGEIIPYFEEEVLGFECTPEMKNEIKHAYNEWWNYAQDQLMYDEEY